MNTFPPATNGDVIACADGCCPATTAWIEREPFVGPSSNGLPGNDQFFGYISNDGLSAVTVSARGFQTPTPTAQHHFYRYFGGVWEAESGPSETDLRAGALFAYIAAYTGDAFVVVRNRTTGFDLALWRRAPGGAYSQVAVAESFATNLTSVSGTMDFERIFVGRYNNTGTVEELNRQATGFTRTTIATFNAAPVISSSSDGSRILIGQQEWNNNFRWLGARAYVRLAGSWIDETPSGGTSGDGGVSSGFGEGPARITQDGTRIYVLNGQISVWNRSGSTWTQESSTTSGTTYSQVNNTPSVSGDGRYVFSGDTQSGAGLMGIYEYRAGTQPRFQRSLAPVVGLSLGYSPAGASFSADGSRALVNSGGNRIAFIERR